MDYDEGALEVRDRSKCREEVFGIFGSNRPGVANILNICHVHIDSKLDFEIAEDSLDIDSGDS